MSVNKTISAIRKTKQFQSLVAAGLKFSSTDRQLSNGSLAFTGKIGSGKKAIRPKYVITANGAVISNEFVARRVRGTNLAQVYRNGLEAVSEILNKRLA
jgi:hypothetical protein